MGADARKVELVLVEEMQNFLHLRHLCPSRKVLEPPFHRQQNGFSQTGVGHARGQAQIHIHVGCSR